MRSKYKEAYGRFRALRNVVGIVEAWQTIGLIYGRAIEQKIWDTYLSVPAPSADTVYLWKNRAAWLEFTDRRWAL